MTSRSSGPDTNSLSFAFFFTALQIARDKLVSLGTPVGKLTHSGKFRLTIGALELLSRYAKHKVSLRAGGCCTCVAQCQALHAACTAYWCVTGVFSWQKVGLYHSRHASFVHYQACCVLFVV
jgi:hypothetical protein